MEITPPATYVSVGIGGESPGQHPAANLVILPERLDVLFSEVVPRSPTTEKRFEETIDDSEVVIVPMTWFKGSLFDAVSAED